jgi:hypothetical protein
MRLLNLRRRRTIEKEMMEKVVKDKKVLPVMRGASELRGVRK